MPTRRQDCLYRGTNLRRDVYLTFTPTFRSCSENRLPIYSETSLSPGLFVRSLNYHRLYVCLRDTRYSDSQVLRRWLCFLRLLLIEYQYNLPTSGVDLGRVFRPIETAPFVLSFNNTGLLILEARSCGPTPRKHNLKSHPRPTRSPGSFGSQRAPCYRKSSGFKTFLGSAVTSLFTGAH